MHHTSNLLLDGPSQPSAQPGPRTAMNIEKPRWTNSVPATRRVAQRRSDNKASRMLGVSIARANTAADYQQLTEDERGRAIERHLRAYRRGFSLIIGKIISQGLKGGMGVESTRSGGGRRAVLHPLNEEDEVRLYRGERWPLFTRTRSEGQETVGKSGHYAFGINDQSEKNGTSLYLAIDSPCTR